MAFGFNTTRTFVVKFSATVSKGALEFGLGFTEELLYNVTRPAEAGAAELIETQLPIDSSNWAKTASTAVATTLCSGQIRGKIFSVIAGATTNLI